VDSLNDTACITKRDHIDTRLCATSEISPRSAPRTRNNRHCFAVPISWSNRSKHLTSVGFKARIEHPIRFEGLPQPCCRSTVPKPTALWATVAHGPPDPTLFSCERTRRIASGVAPLIMFDCSPPECDCHEVFQKFVRTFRRRSLFRLAFPIPHKTPSVFAALSNLGSILKLTKR